MSFALGTLAGPEPKSGRAAMRVDGPRPTFWPLEEAADHAGAEGISADLMDLFGDWSGSMQQLKRVEAAIREQRVPAELAIAEDRARLGTPLQFPRKAFCVGANYADHLAEMNASHIKKLPGVAPFFFMKPPSTTLVGPGKTVHIPRGCDNFDWEVELVVVLGRAGRNIKPEDAMSHVAGYSVGVDFTSRNQLVVPDTFFKFNFTLGKCQDTTAPVGPVFTPAEFIRNGQDLQFGLWVNGQRKQWTSSANMIYSIAEQIAGVSEAIAIEPGDIMFTGSPAGVGMPRGEKLRSGDRVRVEAEHIGSMEVVIQPPFN